MKPDQKPLQHLADWKRIIVPTLTNYDSLKEEPTLMFMRDARCTLKYEKKASQIIRTDNLFDLIKNI